MAAYQDAIRHTATPEAQWVVVPSNRKWFARLVVAAAIVDALEELNLQFPPVNDAKRQELEKGRLIMEREGKRKKAR